MATDESHANSLLVAAMDFGTTYSGYAFSFRDKPMNIQTNPNWVAGSEKLISLKNPTCVLLKPNKEFHSFGFEAENKYGDLAEDDEHHDWYMFRRFKMLLHKTDNLTKNTTIEDILGKEMPALDIFAHAIRYLKDHLMKTLHLRTTGVTINDILFVLTLPAIWDEKAKQFMRMAANEAGIKNDHLKIALEPEAASIWCQFVTSHELSSLSSPGTKYMVVDLGGGTADITVHQKMANGFLKEIHKATGGAWGGNEVDKAYLALLTSVFGRQTMQDFKTTQMSDYFDVLRDFETKKRTITTEVDGKITIKVPASLKDTAEKYGEIMKMADGGDITLTGDKLRIRKIRIQALFNDPIRMIIEHMMCLFSDPLLYDVNAILLVGGFGECELVKRAFLKTFQNSRLIIPDEAGLAVLKGAVRFGHLPQLVSVRVSRFAFGREVWPSFDEKRHDSSKKSEQFGKLICKEVFWKMVDVGEEIPIGKEIIECGSAMDISQISACIKIFSSESHNPMYVTSPGCKFLGSIEIQLPDGKTIEDKKHKIILTFGDTELKVRVITEKDNKSVETTVECF